MIAMIMKAYQVDWRQSVEVCHCHSMQIHTTLYDPFVVAATEQQSTQRNLEICLDHLYIIIIIIIIIMQTYCASD